MVAATPPEGRAPSIFFPFNFAYFAGLSGGRKIVLFFTARYNPSWTQSLWFLFLIKIKPVHSCSQKQAACITNHTIFLWIGAFDTDPCVRNFFGQKLSLQKNLCNYKGGKWWFVKNTVCWDFFCAKGRGFFWIKTKNTNPALYKRDMCFVLRKILFSCFNVLGHASEGCKLILIIFLLQTKFSQIKDTIGCMHIPSFLTWTTHWLQELVKHYFGCKKLKTRNKKENGI